MFDNFPELFTDDADAVASNLETFKVHKRDRMRDIVELYIDF